MPDESAPTITFSQPATATYDGQRYTFRPGDTWTPSGPDAGPCKALDFLGAVFEQNNRLSLEGDPGTRGAFEDLVRRCASEVGGAGGRLPPPPTPPPPVQDPSQTGQDRRPPSGEPSSRELNAPAPQTLGRMSQTGPGPDGDGGGGLGERYHAPGNRLTDGDVVDRLAGQGLGPGGIRQGLLDAQRNAPPNGQPHPDHGRDGERKQPTGNDPVILFTGQFAIDATDVSIPCRGLPLELRRTYRSGPVAFGPFGFNWDHNYNQWARPLDGGAVAIWGGELHEDVFRPRPEPGPNGERTFEPPSGVFDRLWHEPASLAADETYRLTTADDVTFLFSRPTGWPLPDRLPLTRIEDGPGSGQDLEYDPAGRLARVRDEDGRHLALEYDDRDLLARLTDHTGRTWTYSYEDGIEHLVAVTTPATEQFQDGVTTCYRYSSEHPHPSLQHALVAVVDGLGQTVVENEYGQDPGSLDWNRVVRQVFAGYEATYSYTGLQLVWPDPEAINVPVLRVEMVDPGILYVHTFNYRGNLLDRRYRLILDGTYRLHAEAYRYDAQGNQIEYRSANGLGIRRLFDHANPDPRARGNPLRVWRLPPPTSAAAERELSRFTYEPRHNRLKSIRDESGGVTTLVYDYEETTVDRGNVIRVEHPPATLPDGTTQGRSETFEYDERGQLVESRSGEGHIVRSRYGENGPSAGLPIEVVRDAEGTAVAETHTYDTWGNLASVADGRGNTTRFERDALGNLLRIARPAVDGRSDEVRLFYRADGRLVRRETPRGEYDDPVIAGDTIVDTFDYDLLGHVTTSVYGANTDLPRRWEVRSNAEGRPIQETDPVGRVHRYRYDERGLVLERRLRLDGGGEAIWGYAYDRVGRLVRETDAAGLTWSYEYDPWGRLIRLVEPGADPAVPTVTSFRYGPGDRLESMEIVGAPGHGEPPATLVAAETTYDEAHRPIRHRVGDTTTTIWYDRDDRPIRDVDQRGAVEERAYDGEDRVVLQRDPAGNTVRYTYDPAGNLIRQETHDTEPSSPARAVRVTTYEHDERDRVLAVQTPLGTTTRFEWDGRDLPVAWIDPLGQRFEQRFDIDGNVIGSRVLPGSGAAPVEEVWERDAVGRVVAYTDPEGHTTRYAYDPFDNLTTITYPDGSQARWETDAAGRVTRFRSPGGTIVDHAYAPDGRLRRLSFGAGPEVAPTPDLELAYDGLGRPTRQVQGPLTLTRRYDLLDRMIEERLGGQSVTIRYDDDGGALELTYPDGRVDRHEYDLLGRLVSIGRLAEGAGSLAASPPGTELVRYEWAGTAQIQTRRLANGTHTEHVYDAGGRAVVARHRRGNEDLLALHHVYDARGLVRLRQEGPAGRGERFGHDELIRLELAEYGLAAPAPPELWTQADADAYLAGLASDGAPESEQFELDRADGPVRSEHRVANTAEQHEYTVNDLLQITRDAVQGEGLATTTAYVYDGDGRRRRDGRHRYVYDAQDRLVRVEAADDGRVLVRIGWDPDGRVREIADAEGSRRLVYAEGTLVQENDGADRPLAQYTFGLTADDLVLRIDAAGALWGHLDLLGSLAALSDGAGELVERYRYRAFGQATVWAPDGLTPRVGPTLGITPRFAGRPWLAPTLPDLYNLRARTYDARTGQLLQRDPAGYEDSPNLYACVGASPTSFFDPTGERRAGTAGGSPHLPLPPLDPVSAFLEGAISSFANIFVEAGKQVWDVGRFGVAAFGAATSLWDYQPRAVSAVGKLAEQGLGTLDILAMAGRSLLALPGRWWQALRRGDWYTAGELSTDLVLAGRSATGLGWGVTKAAFNRGVGALGRFGPRGQALRNSIRTRQVKWMENRAMRVLGPNAARPVFKYTPRLKPNISGLYNPNKGVVHIGESAFTPPLRALWPHPEIKMGARLRVGNLLRGNKARRTVTHEGHHHNQFVKDPTSFKPYPSYGQNPLEFTQPGSNITGAWNIEMRVPAGPISKGVGASSVANNLLGPKGEGTTARQ